MICHKSSVTNTKNINQSFIFEVAKCTSCACLFLPYRKLSAMQLKLHTQQRSNSKCNAHVAYVTEIKIRPAESNCTHILSHRHAAHTSDGIFTKLCHTTHLACHKWIRRILVRIIQSLFSLSKINLFFHRHSKRQRMTLEELIAPRICWFNNLQSTRTKQ